MNVKSAKPENIFLTVANFRFEGLLNWSEYKQLRGIADYYCRLLQGLGTYKLKKQRIILHNNPNYRPS